MDTIKLHPNVDNIISRAGGFPRGRLFEIYGPDGEGKTTLAMLLSASAQREGLKVGYIDMEGGFNPDHAEFFGVDMDALDLRQPMFGEEALNRTIDMCKEGYGLVVIDSVAGLIPEAEAEDDEIVMGGQWAQIASLLAKGLRKVVTASLRGNTCILFLNQIRAKIGGFSAFGPTTESFGGYALKHYTSARFEIRKVAWIKYANQTIGFKLRIRAPKKNRYATPNRDGTLDIICDHDCPSLEKINEKKKTKVEAITFKED